MNLPLARDVEINDVTLVVLHIESAGVKTMQQERLFKEMCDEAGKEDRVCDVALPDR